MVGVCGSTISPKMTAAACMPHIIECKHVVGVCGSILSPKMTAVAHTTYY